MFSRLKMRHVAILIVLGLLSSFQNCSEPLNDSADEMMQAALDAMPFAFQSTVDEVAYMSCTRMTNFDQTAFFSFRAGAYNGGSGLALTPSFLSATQYYTSDMRAQVFQQSSANMGAQLQLAIRQVGNYQNVLSGNQGAVTPGQDTSIFLMELDQNPIASQLGALQMNQWQNYFSGNSFSYANQSGLMQASLEFMESETAALSVRTNLQNRQAALTLTFTSTNAAGDNSARGPAGAIGSTVYGTGYLINFQNPAGWSVSDQRVLSSISEMDLGGGTLTLPHAWTCPAGMEFMIIQPQDVFPTGNIICHETADPAPSTLSASDQQIYFALRNALPASDWFIDMTNHCVVPTSNVAAASCYGDRTGLPPIDYVSTACTPFNQNTNGGAIGTCPHWVSVCIRN